MQHLPVLISLLIIISCSQKQELSAEQLKARKEYLAEQKHKRAVAKKRDEEKKFRKDVESVESLITAKKYDNAQEVLESIKFPSEYTAYYHYLKSCSFDIDENKSSFDGERFRYDIEYAMIEIEEALSINHDFYKAFNQRGFIKMTSKDYKGAISDYETALKIEENTTSFLRLGITYFEQKSYEKAAEMFTKCIKIEAYNDEAYRFRSDAYFLLGMTEEMCSDWSYLRSRGDSKAMKNLAKYCQ